jgi:subtilisin family serine protease
MKRLVALLIAPACWMPFAVHAADVQVLPNRYLVAFQEEVSASEQKQIVEKMGGKVLKQLEVFHMVLADPGYKPSSVFKAELAQQPAVTAIENDFVTNWLLDEPALNVRLDDLKKVRQEVLSATREEEGRLSPRGSEPPGADSEVQWGVKRVNAPAAWPRDRGEGVKVAIIDTGIDPTHPDLAANIAGGYNAVEKDKPWADDHFHGTHVAGIVAALVNGQYTAGVAPKAKLYAVKVLDKDGSGSFSAIMDGMNWAAKNGMRVANMSLGAPKGNSIFEKAVKAMVKSGVTLVAAAGNGDGMGNPSPVNYPAAYKDAIAVSALDVEDHITKWSSRGPQVAFIAPGDNVPSTVPFFNDKTGVHAYSGTSMAAPHVTGLAALAAARGARSPKAIRTALKAAAKRLPGLTSDEQGAGLIDAAKLVH